jgi:hypothetical protein
VTRTQEIGVLQAEYALLMAKRKFAEASRVFMRLRRLMLFELGDETGPEIRKEKDAA